MAETWLRICILPYLRVHLISLCDSVPSLKTVMLAFTWWHYLTDKFINVSGNTQTTAVGAIIHPHRENSFSPKKKKKKQSHTVSEYKREIKLEFLASSFTFRPSSSRQKAKGFASALNQGQMRLQQGWVAAGGGWNWGSSPAARQTTPQPNHLQKNAPCSTGGS